MTEIIDSVGDIEKTYDYDAFGNEISPDSNDTTLFRYCGEYYDSETESIYLRARYYNMNTGRFISEDPIKDGLNWYSYCGGNPVMFWDKLGLSSNLNDSESVEEYLNAYYGLQNIAEEQYFLVKLFNIRFDSAYASVIDNKETINYIANKYGIPADIIGSIIFKEQLTKSIPDSVALSATALGELLIYENSHSVGLGAIFPSTARRAWQSVNPEFSEKITDDDFLLETDLMGSTFNIETIAAVLIYNAKELGYTNTNDVSKLSDEQWNSVIGMYNAISPDEQKDYYTKVNEYRPYIEILIKE